MCVNVPIRQFRVQLLEMLFDSRYPTSLALPNPAHDRTDTATRGDFDDVRGLVTEAED
jgi:hypothetical protein